MRCSAIYAKRIIVIFAIIFSVFFLFGTTLETSYAAGNELYLSDEMTPLANGSNLSVEDTPDVKAGENEKFSKNANIMKDVLGLDIENVGVLSKARHAVATGLATVSSIIYSLQVNLTFIVAIFLNWSDTMPWIDSAAESLGGIINKTIGKTFFNFGNPNSPITLVIFFAMAGIALSIAQMRVTEGVGKAAKMIALIVIAIFLGSQSVTVYKNLNDTTVDLKNKMVEAVGEESVAEAVWDINAVRPWKILEFGDIALTGDSLAVTESKEANNENGAGTPGLQYNTNGGGMTGTVNYNDGTSRSVLDEEEGESTWNWKEIKESKRWKRLKKNDSKGYQDMLGPFKKYVKYSDKDKGGKNGHKMYKFLSTTDGTREEVASVLANQGFGYFKLSIGLQGTRCAMAFVMFLLSLPLTGFTLFITLITVALKLVAMLLFFLWPIVLLMSLATNSLEMVKKWITTVAIMFLAGVVIQFVFALIMALTLQVFGNSINFGYWCLSSILGVALFIGAFIGYPHFMNIIGARGTHLPGQRRAERFLQSQIMANTFGRRVGEALSNNGGGSGSGDGGEHYGVRGHGSSDSGGDSIGGMRDPTEMSDEELEQEMAQIDDDSSGGFNDDNPNADFDEEFDDFDDDEVKNMDNVSPTEFDDNSDIDSDDVGNMKAADDGSAEAGSEGEVTVESKMESVESSTAEMKEADGDSGSSDGGAQGGEMATTESAPAKKNSGEEERIAADNAAKLNGSEKDDDSVVSGNAESKDPEMNKSEKPSKASAADVAAVGKGSTSKTPEAKQQTAAAMEERRKSPAYREKVQQEMERRKREDAKRAAEIKKHTAKEQKQMEKAQKKQAVKNVVAAPAKATGNLAKTATQEKVVKPVKNGVDNRIVKPVKKGVQDKVVDPFNKRVAKPIQNKSQSLTDSINSFSDRIKK